MSLSPPSNRPPLLARLLSDNSGGGTTIQNAAYSGGGGRGAHIPTIEALAFVARHQPLLFRMVVDDACALRYEG